MTASRLTPEELDKMVACSPLLPPPGEEVVRELAAALREAWVEIEATQQRLQADWFRVVAERDAARADAEQLRVDLLRVADAEGWDLSPKVASRIRALAARQEAKS
jgi:hypothetical protein